MRSREAVRSQSALNPPLLAVDRASRAFLLISILSQRLGINIGDVSIPMMIPIVAVALVYYWTKRELLVIRARAAWLSVASVILGASVFANLIKGYSEIGSFLLLLLIILPAAFQPPQGNGLATLRFVSGTMVVFGAVALGQFAFQFIGGFVDLDRIVPPHLQLHGFVSTAEVRFGSGILRANGFVFLEPSFLSQFLAAGIICELMDRRRRFALLALGGGLIVTFSGTGVIMLGAGIVALTARFPLRRRALVIVAVAGCLLGVLTIGPLADLYGARIDAQAREGSSFDSRFSAPYTILVNEMRESGSAWDLLVGRGPGSTKDLLSRYSDNLLAEPFVVKIGYEYGVVALISFALVVNIVILRWGHLGVLALPWAVQMFALQNSVLNSGVMLLTIVAVGWRENPPAILVKTSEGVKQSMALLSMPRGQPPVGSRGPSGLV